MKIKLCSIKLPAKWRIVNQDKVNEIADSFTAIGQLNDVGINQDWELVYGMHRYLAAKLLGWDEIEGKLVDTTDAIKLELANIDENLCRNPLTPLELAQQIKRQLELYNLLNPNAAKHGGDRTVETINTTKAIAEKTGMAERTVRRYKKIAENLKGDVAGTYAFTVGQLQKLMDLSAEGQDYINKNVVSGGLHEGDFNAAYEIALENEPKKAVVHSPGAFNLVVPPSPEVCEQVAFEATCPLSVITRPSIAAQIAAKSITGRSEELLVIDEPEVPPRIIKKQLEHKNVTLITKTTTGINMLKEVLKSINATESDLQLLNDVNNHIIDLININYEEN